MAIQFRCLACSQPIEVDDSLAGHDVTCPYCQKVVTAPAASDPAVNQSAPQARGASPSGSAAPIPTPMSSPGALEPLAYASLPPLPSESNRLAWVSFFLAIVGLVCFVLVNFLVASIIGPQTAPINPQDANKILMDKIADNTAMAVLLAISGMGACCTPLVSAVCAIIALLRRQPPRWPAIVALVIVAGWFLLCCMGMFSFWSQAKAGV